MNKNPTPTALSLNAVEINQNGETLYLASILAGQLITSYKVHIADPKKPISLKNGYQRKPKLSRVKAIAKYFASPEAIMPLGGLANLRKGDGSVKFISEVPKNHPCRHGILKIPASRLPLWLVDSQHRVEGLRHAIQEMEREDLSMYPIILTIIEGKELEWEAGQFDLINTKQKKIDTGLARQSLAASTVGNQRLLSTLTSAGKLPEIQAQFLAKSLNKKCPALKGLIRQPNQDLKDAPSARLTSTTWVNTLKKPLTLPGINRIAREEEELFDLISNYWQAIRELLPEAFEDTKNYQMVRSIGSAVMHMILGDVMNYTNNYTVKGFKKVLTPVFDEFNEDFWLSSNKDDGASTFSSGGQQQKLARALQEVLWEGNEQNGG